LVNVFKVGCEVWKIVQGFIPLADFSSDCYTIYTWYNRCQEGDDEFCLWWKLGTLFICLPSVIGPLFAFFMLGMKRRKWGTAFFLAMILLFWPITSVVVFFGELCKEKDNNVEFWHHLNAFEAFFEAGPQTTLQWILICRGHYNWFSIVSAVISTVALARGIYSILNACCCPKGDDTLGFREGWLA